MLEPRKSRGRQVKKYVNFIFVTTTLNDLLVSLLCSSGKGRWRDNVKSLEPVKTLNKKR